MNIKKQDVTKLLFNKFVTSCFKLYYKFFLKNLGNKVNNLGEIISKSLFFMPPSKIKAIKYINPPIATRINTIKQVISLPPPIIFTILSIGILKIKIPKAINTAESEGITANLNMRIFILKILFNKYYIPTSFAFIGLILGSIPLVVKQANVKKVTLLHVLCMLVAFSFSLYLVAIDGNISSTLNSYNSNSYLILSGAITSAGIVIPGVSKTVLLMFLGIYEIYISAIASLNLSILIPIGIGFAIGGIIFLVLINFLFKIAKSYTYFAIIGFVLCSVFVIYPGFSFNTQGIISIVLLIVSFIAGIKLSNLNR